MAFSIETLLQPGRFALLLSEVQRSVIGDRARLVALAEAAAEVGVIPNSASLASAVRDSGGVVVHCLANIKPGRFGANTNARLFRRGSSRQEPVAQADPDFDVPCPEVWAEGDVISLRDHGLSPMADSQLDHRLRNAGIATVIIAGVSLNVALLDLAMTAVNNGYQVIVASDAVAGIPLDYGPVVMQNTLMPIATITSCTEIMAALPAAGT